MGTDKDATGVLKSLIFITSVQGDVVYLLKFEINYPCTRNSSESICPVS